MYVLGINAVYHDSAACLVQDGKVIAAAEEERFTRVKHAKRPIPFATYELPFHAIDYCLREAGIRLVDVDHVAYSYDPFLLLGRHRDEATITLPLEPSAHPTPAEWESAWDPLFLSSIVNAPRHLAGGAPHHLRARFRGARPDGPYRWHFVEHHVAHAASAFLASPFDRAAVLTLDGRGEKATTTYHMGSGHRLERFGPARMRGEPLEQRHYDVAHSLQVVLEESVLELARWLHRATGSTNLCMAGGVAVNCVMNARLRDRGPFKRIWVQPAAGDAGTALGAALWIDAQERGGDERRFRMDHAFLGPAYGDEEIEQFLRWSRLPYRRLANVADETAALLAQDRVVGWFQGRMEFGPRALGARSILASPIPATMQARLNEIKDREDFRPVAPVVLEEEAAGWFAGAQASPFMLFVHDVVPDMAGCIPAVRHVDGTARIQTINRRQHPLYYDLVKAFQARTGVPVLVNTSFNTRGEPIVCSPRDAVECFWTSPLDALVIGSYLLEKASAQ